jgi:hypothetical protein
LLVDEGGEGQIQVLDHFVVNTALFFVVGKSQQSSTKANAAQVTREPHHPDASAADLSITHQKPKVLFLWQAADQHPHGSCLELFTGQPPAGVAIRALSFPSGLICQSINR